MKDAGLSPDQIAAVLTAFASHGAASPHPTPAQTAPTPVAERLTLSDLIPRFTQYWIDERIEENDGDKKDNEWTPPSTDETKLRRVVGIIGGETLIDTINHESAKRVRRELRKLSANNKPFRSLSVAHIIEKTEGQGLERLSAKTANNYLELYSRLFAFARKRQLVSLTPFDDVRVKQTKKQCANSTRDMFTREDLRKIFSTSPHTTPDLPTAYRYREPLIGLYTGARRVWSAGMD